MSHGPGSPRSTGVHWTHDRGQASRPRPVWSRPVTPRLLLVLLPAAVALLLVPLVQRATAQPGAAPVSASCRGEQWVAAWRAAPQGSSLGRPDDEPWGDADGLARTFDDQTLRMVLTPSIDGSGLRVRFGNRFGPAPVTITAATIGTSAGGAAVDPATVQGVTFGGDRSVTIAAGAAVVSDPLFGPVAGGVPLSVTMHVAGPAVLDHHQWALAPQYLAPAGTAHLDDATGTPFSEELTGWYGVSGVDVLAPRGTGVVVALGDSITDGIGSTPGADRRWPDVLARRLAAGDDAFAVVNAGIAGNHVVTSGLTSVTAIGPSLLDRFATDALAVDGLTDLLVFAGINDIYMAGDGTDIAPDLIAAYEQVAATARAAGARVLVATITPASLSADKEEVRVRVNDALRASDAFDAVVDFDAAARDLEDPSRLRPEWDAGFAHLNDAGYAALAAAVPLDALQGASC